MNCETFEHELDGLIAGRTNNGLRAELEGHLAACPVCRGLADAFGRLLKAAPGEPPPIAPDFTARLMHTMAGCSAFAEVADEFAAGRLTGSAKATAQSHVAACPVCRGLNESLVAVRSAQIKTPPALSAEFPERVMTAVRRQSAPRVVPLKLMWWGLAAAAAAVAFSFFVRWYQAPSPNDPNAGTVVVKDAGTVRPPFDPKTPLPRPVPDGGSVVQGIGDRLREPLALVTGAPLELPDANRVRDALVQASVPAEFPEETDAALSRIGRDGAHLARAGADLSRQTASGLAGFVMRQSRLFDVRGKVQGS